MSVTVVDIAKKATVSVTTVSRVLNNQPNVGSDRRQRVLSAMEDLNYTPNRWARGIRKNTAGRKTGQIALLILNIPDYVMHTAYMMQYIHGVQQEIATEGRKCLFLTWNEKSDDGEIPHILLDGEVDGVVFKGGLHGETARRWLNRYPKVSLNHPSSPPDCDCILVDYEAGIYDTVEYLAARGHRRIAMVESSTWGYLPYKLLGYRNAVKRFGLDADDDLIQTRDVSLDSDLTWAIDNLWSLSNPPTAILSNDYFCGTIYRDLANRGLKVPDDVSLIGYDNAADHCEALTPKLTSMDIGAVELGKTAVKQLLERIKNPKGRHQKIHIQGKMVERESVKDRTTGNRQ